MTVRFRRGLLQRIVLATLTVLALSGCSGNAKPHQPASRSAESSHPERRFHGSTPLVINNRTEETIEHCTLSARPSRAGQVKHVDIRVTIPPGTTHQFSVMPGTYTVSCRAQLVRFSASTTNPTGDRTVLYVPSEDVSGPTELMVHDQATPPAAATPGLRLVAVVSSTERARQSKADQQQRRAEAEARCAQHRSMPQQRPRPGRVKISGRWQCVLGGGASGTNWITFAQLANGRVTATIVGVDRDTTLDGALFGDRLHYTMTSGAAGILTIDPGGHAMTGGGSRLSNGTCTEWTLTCTR